MTCVCQGPRCSVCRIVEGGGTLAQEFSAGVLLDGSEGLAPVEVYDLRQCSCPRCETCRAAPLLPPPPGGNVQYYDTPAECEWNCAATL